MPDLPNLTSQSGSELPRWFRADRDASEKIFRKNYPDSLPSTFFHYTSSAALISIIQNNEIWLSDATFLNDRSEVKHGRDIALQCLNDAISARGRKEMKAMLRETLALFETKPDPIAYTACFSWEADDLSQWRGYGKGNSPVSIEFEYRTLMFGYASEAIISEVQYDIRKQRWILNQVLQAYKNAYTEEVRNPNPNKRPISKEKEQTICASKLYNGLWRYIVAFKDAAFKQEREVRYIYLAHDFSGGEATWFPEHPTPKFREYNGRIIPYLSSNNLNFQNLPPVDQVPLLPIRSIRIGPIDDPALTERGIRRLLDIYGHKDIPIVPSNSPYRAS